MIAQELSALRLLRTLRLHLDFADTPERTMPSRWTSDLWYNQGEITEFRRGRLTNTARVFARLLAPSVGSIWMLHPADGRSEWAGFQVAPAGTAGTPDAEVEPICEVHAFLLFSSKYSVYSRMPPVYFELMTECAAATQAGSWTPSHLFGPSEIRKVRTFSLLEAIQLYTGIRAIQVYPGRSADYTGISKSFCLLIPI